MQVWSSSVPPPCEMWGGARLSEDGQTGFGAGGGGSAGWDTVAGFISGGGG